jgi:GNAT superfamily N-acetyltransferase
MAKRKGARGGPTLPSRITGKRLVDGWAGSQGGRIRLARPGEVPAVDGHLAAVGVDVDERIADGVDDGTLAATLRAGLDSGHEGMFPLVAQAALKRDLGLAVPGLSLVLVGEDSSHDPVAALFALPPASLVSGGADQGIPGEELLGTCMAVAKISGLAVAEHARGNGWGSQLLKRTVQVYQQLHFLLLYGQYDADSTLEAFYSRHGFTSLATGQGLSLDPILDQPIGLTPGPNERMFTRWRR